MSEYYTGGCSDVPLSQADANDVISSAPLEHSTKVFSVVAHQDPLEGPHFAFWRNVTRKKSSVCREAHEAASKRLGEDGLRPGPEFGESLGLCAQKHGPLPAPACFFQACHAAGTKQWLPHSGLSRSVAAACHRFV